MFRSVCSDRHQENDSGRCCCLSRLLEDHAKTEYWRISVLKCADGKLVGLGSLEWGRGVCAH